MIEKKDNVKLNLDAPTPNAKTKKKRYIILGVSITLIVIIFLFLSGKKETIMQQIEEAFGENVILPKSTRADLTGADVIGKKEDKQVVLKYGDGRKEPTRLSDDYTKTLLATLVIEKGEFKPKDAVKLDLMDKTVYQQMKNITKNGVEIQYTYADEGLTYILTVELSKRFHEQDALLMIEQIVTETTLD